MRVLQRSTLPTRRLIIGAVLAMPFVRTADAGSTPRITATLSRWPGIEPMPPVLAFDASPGGSTLTARRGQPLDLAIANDSPVAISLHWRGLRAIAGTTGLAETVVAPGETLAMGFTPPDAGILILEGRTQSANAPPSRLAKLVSVQTDPVASGKDMPRDLVLALARTPAPPLSGGSRWQLNGHAAQTVFLPTGDRLRLRLANVADAVVLVGFRALDAYAVALDGQPTDTPFRLGSSRVPLAPGSRADFIIEGPAGAGDVVIQDELAEHALLHVVADPSKAPQTPLASPSVAPNPLLPVDIDLAAATRGTARFGAMDKGPILTAKAGRPVVVTLDNPAPGAVVFHLRGQSFRVLHALDDGWQPYWLDTLIVAPASQSLVAFVPPVPGEWRIEASPITDVSTHQVTAYRID